MASTYSSLYVHIVFATEQRAPMIGDAWERDLHAYLSGTATGLGAKAIAVGGVADHVHILVGLRATHVVSDLVRELKKSSSSWAAERYAKFGWQRGYAAFSVGWREIPAVTKYIAGQAEHHRVLTSDDELRSLLEEHGIDHDPAYFE